MNVLTVSVTDAGCAIAGKLPYEAAHGRAGDVVRGRWDEFDAFVLVLATGAAVRIVGPLLGSKTSDPAVVCVDESGRWVVPLCGGHAAGANALAREVAALLGATAVVTTATDASCTPALDLLPGFVADGDVAGVTSALLAGRAPILESDLPDWPLPAALPTGSGPETVRVTDRTGPPCAGEVRLHPPSLVVGLGCSSDAGVAAGAELLHVALADAGLSFDSVGLVTTIDRRRTHPAVAGIERPVFAYPAAALASVAVPHASPVVERAVGTPSVAEAAALLAAGPGAELVISKQKSAQVTVAVARRRRPPGRLSLVGLGPGGAAHRTSAATAAVRHAQVVIGYSPYLDQAADLLTAAQVVEPSPIGAEVERARRALELAASGYEVALVCSGDAGVYAMASVVGELAPVAAHDVEVDVVPGVTAGLAAAALLGAPLGHDHAVISLSDLLTPWDAIEQRIHGAGSADLVIVFYNPRSQGRTWQLPTALDILRHYRPPDTPVGVVTEAFRPAQHVAVRTLGTLAAEEVGMTTCVIVGATTTRVACGRMVTPRGYKT